MARYLSLYRRRNNLIDVNLQSGTGSFIAARANAASYDFQASANFDGSYTTFQNVPASGGFRSASVPDVGFDGEQFSQSRIPHLTRFLFCPSDYIGAVPAVNDLSPIWLRIIQHNLDGSSNAAEAGHLILPYSSTPNRPLMISGTAPSETTIASSLELQLPMRTNNVQIQNNGAVPLMVAFEPNGPEFPINPVSIDFVNLYTTYPSVSMMLVRGSGGSCQFNVIGAIQNNSL